MKTFNAKLYCLLSLLLLACTSKQQSSPSIVEEEVSYPIHIPFEQGIEDEREVTLSQIAEKAEYNRLETTNKSLIESLMLGTIRFDNNYWYIYEGDRLLQFAADGKFVRQFGSKGQGPGEYSYINHFEIDPEQPFIYMFTPASNINVYSTQTGEFKKNITFSKDIDADYMAMLGNDTFAYYIFNKNGQRTDRVILTDQTGSIIKRFPQYESFDTRGQFFSNYSLWDRYFSHYNDKLLLNEIYNDTLFVVTKDSLLPRYCLQLGKHKLPFEKRFEILGNFQQYKQQAAPYLHPWMLETDRFVFIPFTNWTPAIVDLRQLAIFDKKSEICYKVKGGYIRNDLAPGLPMRPSTIVNDNTLICVWNAETIIEMAEKDPSILENPQLKGLKEDDNPVLMTVTLK